MFMCVCTCLARGACPLAAATDVHSRRFTTAPSPGHPGRPGVRCGAAVCLYGLLSRATNSNAGLRVHRGAQGPIHIARHVTCTHSLHGLHTGLFLAQQEAAWLPPVHPSLFVFVVDELEDVLLNALFPALLARRTTVQPSWSRYTPDCTTINTVEASTNVVTVVQTKQPFTQRSSGIVNVLVVCSEEGS